MRIAFKVLLVPLWMLLTVLKLAIRLAASAATFILAIC